MKTDSRSDKPEVAFLLGCERCGSTWLANVIDAHPDAELYMEPFADYAGLFPGIPERFVHVSSGREDLSQTVRRHYRTLPDSKYPLLYRRGRPLRLKDMDDKLVRLFEWSSRLLHRRTPLSVLRYRLLQLHTQETPLDCQARKARRSKLLVTKELRLNFKVRLLCDAFPGARFLVLLRDPVAQLASVLRLMTQDRLGELRRALGSFDRLLAAQDQLRPLADALPSRTTGETTSPCALARWWYASYTVLLRDLEEAGAPHQVLYHDKLARTPAESTVILFAFLGLKLEPSVERYLQWSTSGTSPENSFVGTQRRLVDIRSAGANVVQPGLLDAVATTHDALSSADMLHPALQRFRPNV